MTSAATPLPLPAPRVPIRVRVATLADVPFMDSLQKKYSKALGFFPRAQMEGYVNAGNVLVAEATVESGELRVESKTDASSLSTLNSPLSTRSATLLAYVAYRDRYLKRDELGVIYQLCVSPDGQRKLVGANLLKEVFARSPYGCKVYCCWCAQDLAANKFWEAMGFQAIAFRTGSAKRGQRGSPRVHIFWQKRTRDDATPWWYPSETGGGAIKENRLVLPIPAGMRWDEEMPVILPGAERGESVRSESRNVVKKLPSVDTPTSTIQRVAGSSPFLSLSRPSFGRAVEMTAAEKVVEPEIAPTVIEPKREKKPAAKNDPTLVKKARELRDRWLEHMNAEPIAETGGKYAIARSVDAAVVIEATSPKLIAA